jgi:hypothetical protein
VLDSHFNLIPTYDQNFIQNVTPVFTGWNYGQTVAPGGRLPTSFGPAYNGTSPMTLVASQHDLGQKEILDNVWLPAAVHTVQTDTTPSSNPQYYNTNTDGSTTLITNAYDENGYRDLTASLNSIFNHTNLGPFLCRQLIQRLVTSNPSPGYVYRVTQAFNGLGNVDGVVTNYRGDMKDTIRAILLDYEARSSTMLASTNTTFGKQREPLLRVTAPARYFAPATQLATATFQQPSTLTGSASAHPGRIEIDFTGIPYPLVTINSDTVQLDFSTVNPGHQLPTAYNGYGYVVRNSVINGGNQSIEVDAYGQTRGSWTQSGNTITVTLSGHGLTAGGAVYLVFAPGTLAGGGNTTPAANVYTVLSAGLTTSVFEVTAASSATTTGSADVLLNSIPSSGISVNGGTTTVDTVVPHGLAAGGLINISGGTVVILGQSQGYTVLTPASATTTATRLTIATPGGLGNQGTGGLIVYPLTAPDMTRNGTLTAFTSNWNIGYTDVNNTDIQQTPLRSTTVFNFFYPGYMFPGAQLTNGTTITSTIIGALATAGVTTPEFQLTSAANTMSLTNFIEQGFDSSAGNITSGRTNGLTSFRAGSENMVMDLSPYMTTTYFPGNVVPSTPVSPGAVGSSSTGVAALVDKFDLELTGGQMATSGGDLVHPQTREMIINYIVSSNFTSSTSPVRDAVRCIAYLVLTCPEFAIQK